MYVCWNTVVLRINMCERILVDGYVRRCILRELASLFRYYGFACVHECVCVLTIES